MNTYEERQDAYDAAREELSKLIDNPEKHLPAAQYRAHLTAAQRAVNRAHADMMASLHHPRADWPDIPRSAYGPR